MMRTSSRRPSALIRPLCGALLVLLTSCVVVACSKSAPPAVADDATPYAAVARGRVAIEGGLLALAMPREGTLASVAVHPGDTVQRGQVLATLDTHPAELAVQAAQADVAQAKAQRQLAEVKQAAAKQRADRLAAAAAAGAGDGQSADDAREAAAQAAAEGDAAQAAVDLAEQKLASAKYELAQRSLRAPVDATVVTVATQPGASVSPSSGALFTLLPDKPRIVHAELNESFVGAIKPGMAAQVVANDDVENGHWRAHVLRIGQVYGPATLENDPQIRANARTVDCVLAFDQPQPQLRIGQRVIVRFLAAGDKK